MKLTNHANIENKSFYGNRKIPENKIFCTIRTWKKAAASALCSALLCSGFGQPLCALAAEPAQEEPFKKETVYILADPEGSVGKIIVSDWLKNPSGENTIIDRSTLTNVENVKGEEKFTLGADQAIVWSAGGNDIYYQGSTDKELPVGVSVTYTLDGKKVAPEDLAGRSGKLTIRYEYDNRAYEYAQINGVKTKIYVPFMALTGMNLDDEVFSNVEVTRGELINDGRMTFAVGAAFPGLQENLGIHTDDLDIPDSIEITADVKNYKSGIAFTIITNELFSRSEGGETDSMEDLKNPLGDLTNATKQLKDGSSQLYEGLCALLEKSGELGEGIDKLCSGAGALQTGAEGLNDGAAKLHTGAETLQSGLNALASSNDQLNGGARQIFETLLAAAQTQLSAQMSPLGISLPDMTIDNYADVLNGIMNALPPQSEGVQAVSALKASLDSYHTFYCGLQSYTAGVSQAAAGAGALKTGTDELKNGAGRLSAGMTELQNGLQSLQASVPALTDGVTQLRDGAKRLSEGINELDEKTAQKLAEAMKGNPDELADRLRAISDASKRYRSFSGISDDMGGCVKFIYRIDAIDSER